MIDLLNDSPDPSPSVFATHINNAPDSREPLIFIYVSACFEALSLTEEMIDEPFKSRPICKLVEILI